MFYTAKTLSKQIVFFGVVLERKLPFFISY